MLHRVATLAGCIFPLMAMVLLCAVAGRAEAADARLPVPDEAAQQEARKLIREVFADQYAEYEKARTSGEKAAVAQSLLAKADQIAGSPRDQFVLLQIVRDMAADAGDAGTALAAVAQTANRFAVEADSLRVETLIEAAAAAQLPEHRRRVVEEALGLIPTAIAGDDFQSAERLIDAAQEAARRIRDPALLKRLAALDAEVATYRKAEAELQPALATLAKDSTDPEANLAAGRYYCLVRGRWQRGMGMLALGSDPKLKALAAKELTRPTDPAQRMELADGWWKLAEEATGPAEKHLRSLAAARYADLLPSLSGLAKTKVQKRLATVKDPIPPLESLLAGEDASYLADKKILLIFANRDELSQAVAACKKYRLQYEVASDFDMTKTDYAAYHTIMCGSNMMDYWGKSDERKRPEAFQHILDFVNGGGHLVVLGSFNGRNNDHLQVFGIKTSYYQTSFFEPAGKPTELLFASNEEILPKDGHMQSAGNFTCSAAHTVLLKRAKGSYAGQPALATLRHEQGRVTFTLCEPYWRGDLWLITVLTSWISRGSPTGEPAS